jgi:AcrR family transcriptional regulator
MPPDSGGRAMILATSAKLFGQRGYKGVSIRDIAQAAGMTNAALYYHFKNKEDLFLAMLQDDHEKTMASLQTAACGPGDLRDDLKQLMLRYAEITCQQRQSFQMLWRDMRQIGDARGPKLFGEMRHGLLHPLEERLEAAQAAGEIQPGDARLYARLLHGMMMALAFGGKPGKPVHVSADEVDAVISIFLNGVGRKS